MALLDLTTELCCFASNKLIEDLVAIHLGNATELSQVYIEEESLRKIELLKELITSTSLIDMTEELKDITLQQKIVIILLN